MDGSAAPFVAAIDAVGLATLNQPKRYIKVLKPVQVAMGDAFGEMRPNPRGFRIEAQVEFDHSLIGRQSLAIDVKPDTFRRELARARTFGFMRDVTTLWNAGYALGASLENTLVVSDNRILNPEGKRFPDEFVRHKILDAVGDLALAGRPLARHVPLRARRPQAQPCGAVCADGGCQRVDLGRRGGAATGAGPCRGRRPAWRRPSGPIFPEPGFSGRTPSRACHIPGEMSAYFLRPDGDLSGKRRRDKARRGRSDLVPGEGHPIHVFAFALAVKDLAGGVRVLTRLAALVLVAASLGACSLFDKDTVIPDEPADKLYNEGLYLLNSKKSPKEAAKKFEEVDRQHPYSEWARKSLIMSAYAYYEAGAYDDCINAARRYVTLHPGSPGRRLCAVSHRRVLFRPDT